MDNTEKLELINDILECYEEAIDLESDDEKEDILIGLLDICEKATMIPVRHRKRQFVKVWREKKSDKGSFSFLTKELLVSDKQSYRNYLRMNEEQFNIVLSYIKDDIARNDTQMRDAITPAERLAVTLRFLATGETFQSLNFDSRLSKSSISNIIPEVCDAIWKRMNGLYMKFPTSPSEWESIANEFAIKWQFPNCIGAIDGKHITFRSSRSDGAFYYNYKGTFSIVLMALVDANSKFIFVDVGCNGRNNDAGVFLQSKLSTVLREEKGLPQNATIGSNRCLPFVVVGDDAFPMQKHLLKPYPYHSNSREKQVYNIRHSRARHVAEHSFGILANRFRIFLAPINLKVDTVEKITLACCVLHNFLTQNNTVTSCNENSTIQRPIATSDSTYNPRRGVAEDIRQQFMAYFNNEGKLDWLPNTINSNIQ